ncbi:ATP synthase subunit I [Natroniella sulfidigena]|uniref:ATP synthase subunit I n=1 Tax=Natroniella sulfidigena TaxID=723921 RepID=UPI00200AA9AB|nr:ATP synthase subunit I [Natroniella sulfidigena]MCK8816398.1 ATP synthase subunit I [Natroniella sulfidigena]
MKAIQETKLFILKWTALLDFCILLLLFVLSSHEIVFGFFVGSVMSLINFQLLSMSLQKAVEFSPIKAGIYVFVQYIIRYMLWFAVFYIALQRNDVNLLTTVIGTLTVKLVVLTSNALNYWTTNQKYSEF